MKKISVGGQAVLEGVMMRGPDTVAVAVRRADGEIVVETEPYVSPSKKHRWMGWPLVRGVVNFVQMMSIGMRTLTKSAEMYGEEEEEPTRFEKAVAKATGKQVKDVVPLIGTALGIVMAVGLFFLLPSWLISLFSGFVEGRFALSVIEGVIRISLFLGYVLLISRMKDIQRVFAYHGAEHKAVATYEADMPLTPQNAKVYSRLHPRCGTSFILVVMVMGILIFAILGRGADHVLLRMLSRIALLPVVVSLSYEVLRFLSARENACVRFLRAPGLSLQYLTTREPDEEMLEVAIVALKAALKMEDAAGAAPEDKVAEASTDQLSAAAPAEADEAPKAESKAGNTASVVGSVVEAAIDIVTDVLAP